MVDSYEDACNHYIVTKFMPAGDLLNYLQKQPVQPLTEVHAKKIIRQVLEALEDLHERRIVHRDIKVENILMSDLSESARVRIADFGSSIKLGSAEEKTSFRIGTPGYIAPEIILG